MVNSSDFDNSKGVIRKKAIPDRQELEKKLRDLKSHVTDQLTTKTDMPTTTWLNNVIDEFHNPGKGEETLFSFMRNFIDQAVNRPTASTNRPVCYKQIREYERTFHYLKQFSIDNKRDFDWQDIDLNFYYDFIQYLQSEKTVKNKKGKEIKEPGLAQNTVGKKIQTLKIFLNAASEQGMPVNPQYKSHRFTAISEESENIYLNEEDLQKIAGCKLSDCLDKIRDQFLIGCWTGLRFSDWNKLTKENIDDGFLEVRQEKTGKPVVIPLHSEVDRILKKYKGKLPRLISNQKFNDYLKEIAKAAKLDEIVHKSMTKGGIRRSVAHKKHELVSAHTARRSFATNLYKQGFPTLSIMQITGHKTETSFLKYIKVTPKEHAQKLREFWQLQIKLKAV
jgi:integrase